MKKLYSGRSGGLIILVVCFLLLLYLFYISLDKTYVIESVRETTLKEVETTSIRSTYVGTSDEVLQCDALLVLEQQLGCHDRDYETSIQQRGDYWVMQNLVKAGHGAIRCFETVTYTTHGHFTFLDNLEPLLTRWKNPLSVAIFAPGADFPATIETIRYIRDCSASDVVTKYATFHVFFPYEHMGEDIQNSTERLHEEYDCSTTPPFISNDTYASQNKLSYPINVARNIAREAALTHYVFAADIELYPSPHLAERFLNMIVRSEPPLDRPNPRVFPLHFFEVEADQQVPWSKGDLQRMLKAGTAIPFHKKLCLKCHDIPMSDEWQKANQTDQLGVFNIGKRQGPFAHWEPFYIGNRDVPGYDERLTWEGKSDKMSQGYIFCALDYDFMILNDAFIVHKPGIKTSVQIGRLWSQTKRDLQKISQELKSLYGDVKNCTI